MQYWHFWNFGSGALFCHSSHTYSMQVVILCTFTVCKPCSFVDTSLNFTGYALLWATDSCWRGFNGVLSTFFLIIKALNNYHLLKWTDLQHRLVHKLCLVGYIQFTKWIVLFVFLFEFLWWWWRSLVISLATFLVDFTTSASQVATVSGFLNFCIYRSGFLDFCIYRFWVSGLLHLPFLGFWTSASTVSGLWRVRYHFWTLGDLPCLRNNLLRHMWRLPRT